MGKSLGYYTDTAISYAKSVLSGKTPACKWVKAACRRQLDDLDFWLKDSGYRFEYAPDQAEHVCKFIELLPHIKGKWAGTRIKLEAWQIFILTTVFGWYHKDGYRRYRTVYIEVPRKNAKSTLTSGVSLYMLTADAEPGAEIFSAATTAKQARIVFDVAKKMVERTPGLRRRYKVKPLEHSIKENENGGEYVPLSAEGSTLDGLNIHFASVDELHAHKTRAVYDVLDTAMGARSQPMLWSITTAGSDQSGICYEQRDYVTSLLNGTLIKHDGLGYPIKGSVANDDSYFGIIYTIDDDDNWSDPSCWEKANPNYGVSVYEDDLQKGALHAERMPGTRNNFKTKRLNVWVNASIDWMDMRKWEHCVDNEIDISDFAGEKCWTGMDLAEKSDFAALVTVFWRNGHLYVFPRLYLNDEAIETSKNSQMIVWRDEGHIIGNEGDITDFDNVRDDLVKLKNNHDLQEVPFDPAMGMYFVTKLTNDYELPMVQVAQKSTVFSPAATELENLVLERKIHFKSNPAFSWMISNVVMSEPSKFSGLRSPHKTNSANKIDGAIALLLAISRAMLAEDKGSIDEFINEPIYG
ncbi:terminase large subunit [Nitrosomonas marina]|uniref:Phage terminase-like protein, large subunit, contains N-terminal HTH domain n=1 Tax=Nitrosomonas marina TaxID=917 RepID=A0A1H8GI31_9PROT|nr:terminase TerL endonuclease subunit [Nitrosomonas marina]SEN43676.1 Phage terminase-like protein, large subunit, contains N-terminal HTH domain [Nitrosomonas marina]